MKAVEFAEWKLYADDLLTRTAYQKVVSGGADSCTCAYCKNYVKNREHAFPENVKILFHNLGVDYLKDCEVVHYFQDKDGLHHYGGWFHYKGDFAGPDCTVPLQNGGYTTNLVAITPNFSIGFLKACSLSFFDNVDNLVQIEFKVCLAWGIEAPESA